MGRGLLVLIVATVLAACDPGAEAGFAPVEPLPTPDAEPVPALWWPADPGQVGADTSVLDVLVLEQACAGGEPADGRILDPVIDADEDRIVVTFLIEQVQGAATCPSNPPTPAALDLGEPLGDRVLLDGGVDPPREPTPEQ
jgi:hypothetical protein